MNVDIVPASASDFATARGWLEDAGLPVEDLTDRRSGRFLVASLNGVAVGMVGLEHFGTVGLLRSLVVEPSGRARGVGRQLVAALEDAARAAGVRELWLLTIDADRYFERLGYLRRGRDAAPDAIRATAEFSGLCPGDAVLMHKQLG
jgi:amino-acid N-acetyltransferase